jgi:hypothetical protein
MAEKEGVSNICVLSQGQEVLYYYTFENESRNRKKNFRMWKIVLGEPPWAKILEKLTYSIHYYFYVTLKETSTSQEITHF